ncbi:hypothetical protein QOT17_016703 [Balamuthia mandrillaris]
MEGRRRVTPTAASSSTRLSAFLVAVLVFLCGPSPAFAMTGREIAEIVIITLACIIFVAALSTCLTWRVIKNVRRKREMDRVALKQHEEAMATSRGRGDSKRKSKRYSTRHEQSTRRTDMDTTRFDSSDEEFALTNSDSDDYPRQRGTYASAFADTTAPSVGLNEVGPSDTPLEDMATKTGEDDEDFQQRNMDSDDETKGEERQDLLQQHEHEQQQTFQAVGTELEDATSKERAREGGDGGEGEGKQEGGTGDSSSSDDENRDGKEESNKQSLLQPEDTTAGDRKSTRLSTTYSKEGEQQQPRSRAGTVQGKEKGEEGEPSAAQQEAQQQPQGERRRTTHSRVRQGAEETAASPRKEQRNQQEPPPGERRTTHSRRRGESSHNNNENNNRTRRREESVVEGWGHSSDSEKEAEAAAASGVRVRAFGDYFEAQKYYDIEPTLEMKIVGLVARRLGYFQSLHGEKHLEKQARRLRHEAKQEKERAGYRFSAGNVNVKSRLNTDEKGAKGKKINEEEEDLEAGNTERQREAEKRKEELQSAFGVGF